MGRKAWGRSHRAIVIGVVSSSLCCAARSTGDGGRPETRVFVGNCVYRSESEAALAGPLLGALLPKAFNKIGETLEAAAKEKTWQATAFTNFEMSVSARPKCIHVVRGVFEDTAADGTLGENAWAKGTSYAKQSVTLARRGIRLAGKPDFFFEGKFRSSGDGSAVAIVPTVVAFERPIGTRALRSGETRHLKMSFAFHPPGKSATAADVPATELVLGEMSPGDFRELNTASGGSSCLGVSGAGSTSTPAPSGGPPPLPQPAVVPAGAPGSPSATQPAGAPGSPPVTQPAAAGTAGLAATQACLQESLWFALDPPETLQPYSATVVVSEIQDASAFLGFLAEVFGDSKDDLEKAAKVALIDSEREAARLAALETAATARKAYAEAASEAIGALETCQTQGTTAASGEAHVKQRAANLAAAKAGLREPCKDAELVPLNGTASDLMVKCKAALTACTF